MQKIECKSGRTKNVCLDTAVFFCKSQNLWHPIYPVRSFQRFVHEKPWGIFIYPPCSVQKPRCIWSSGSMGSIWDTFVSLDSVVPVESDEGGLENPRCFELPSQMRDQWVFGIFYLHFTRNINHSCGVNMDHIQILYKWPTSSLKSLTWCSHFLTSNWPSENHMKNTCFHHRVMSKSHKTRSFLEGFSKFPINPRWNVGRNSVTKKWKITPCQS